MSAINPLTNGELDSLLREGLGCYGTGAPEPVGGGCIAQAYRLPTSGGALFVKCQSGKAEAFASEAAGLQALYETKTIRVPQAHLHGQFSTGLNYLVLEYIELHTAAATHIQEALGEQLAELHLSAAGERFGFEMDNWLGSTPQQNSWDSDWLQFFTERRLGYQFSLADDAELLGFWEALQVRIPTFFEEVDLRPSLLHGDLWVGNVAADSDGQPVLFDPACYYGHHEAELGITTMFGGFSQAFWESYHSVIPRAFGFEERHALYELYHALNHLNIFGSSYRSSCLRLIQKLS